MLNYQTLTTTIVNLDGNRIHYVLSKEYALSTERYLKVLKTEFVTTKNM